MLRGLWSMGKYRKILVAIDGSESSRNALLQAFRFAVDEKCWITVTSVVPPYDGEIEILGHQGHQGIAPETLRGRAPGGAETCRARSGR